ncbi:MAG: hypothetical protein JWN70_2515 [Planctomycetaceae bacterium]|nr:hypothetical protein [Planctomycetaceae bacterium]
MSDNPYESPRSESGRSKKKVTGVLSGTREDLRSVAQYQRGILVCILINIAGFFGQIMLPPEIRPIVFVGFGLVGLVSTILVFMLALKIYGTGAGIILGILALIPCIGLLVLLVINGKATKILQENGIKVGLLGADPSKI